MTTAGRFDERKPPHCCILANIASARHLAKCADCRFPASFTRERVVAKDTTVQFPPTESDHRRRDCGLKLNLHSTCLGVAGTRGVYSSKTHCRVLASPLTSGRGHDIFSISSNARKKHLRLSSTLLQLSSACRDVIHFRTK